jgi:hypothetical protein
VFTGARLSEILNLNANSDARRPVIPTEAGH